MNTIAPRVDTDLYMDTPLNALTSSSDIIENQLNALGISQSLGGEPVSADDGLRHEMMPLPTRPPVASSPLDIFNGSGLPEFENTVSTTANPEPTAPSATRVAMNGPAPTRESLGDVAESYGLPTSFKTILDDAQDAFVGIIADLTKSKDEQLSYQEIFGKQERLRGLGSLFIIIGIIGVVLGGMSG